MNKDMFITNINIENFLNNDIFINLKSLKRQMSVELNDFKGKTGTFISDIMSEKQMSLYQENFLHAINQISWSNTLCSHNPTKVEAKYLKEDSLEIISLNAQNGQIFKNGILLNSQTPDVEPLQQSF